MDKAIIKTLVQKELERGEAFTNFHGITSENIRSFLIEPFLVRVDPDDLETQPREMWVVLQERNTPTDGYVIVFDPTTKRWGVAEHVDDGNYILVIGAVSMARVLSGM